MQRTPPVQSSPHAAQATSCAPVARYGFQLLQFQLVDDAAHVDTEGGTLWALTGIRHGLEGVLHAYRVCSIKVPRSKGKVRINLIESSKGSCVRAGYV